jgi:hypothetical protein
VVGWENLRPHVEVMGLKENVYLAPICGRDKRFLEGGGGASPELLEAYMGEVVWPHPPRPNGKAFMGIGPM